MRTWKLDTLAEKKCDAVLIPSSGDAPDMNLQYYSGMDARQAGGTVLWKVGREPILITRDTKQKRRARLVPKKGEDTVYRELKKRRAKKIGVNMDYLPASAAKRIRKKSGARLVDISKELKKVRAVKERGEIKNISMACAETRGVLKKLPLLGRTEKAVYAELVSGYAKRGLALAFDPIVAAGKSTTLIHTRPTAKRIGKKDTVIIDTGCIVGGYCSDITVTRCGSPDKRTEKMLLAVFGASRLALREAQPGMKAKELYELVKKGFGNYAKYWPYGLGHGVGLAIHESPSLGPESDDVLEEGMVFTLEPGLVGPGQGARIEYTGVLTSKGFKAL
ncbi:MAG: aminopeptidase P family protein [Candidatus Diapherotrites archaeon]|nr:aminopeptidase P family protein [Candidatus Diapherotrites archaeon]